MIFYAAQKLPPPLRAGSKVMQKTADILLSRQMSAQKAKWMWHGRGNIYNTHRGGFTCQSFSETSGSTFSHVPIPGAQFVEQPTDAEITFFSKKDSSTPQKTPRSQIVPITVKLELKATYKGVYISIQFKYDHYISTHLLVFQVCGT